MGVNIIGLFWPTLAQAIGERNISTEFKKIGQKGINYNICYHRHSSLLSLLQPEQQLIQDYVNNQNIATPHKQLVLQEGS